MILTWNVITYRSLEFWLLRREEHDGWCGCTFRFQNRSFEVKALHLYALDFIEYSFIDEWLAQRSVRSFFTCWAIALKLPQCRPNPSFLSVFRIILTRACLEQNDPYSRHDCPRFLSFQRNLNNHHVFVTIPDISLRKSLIPEVFLDCYCVARKRPIRTEKTMRQTKICQVSTHTEIHFIQRRARKSCLFFFKNRGRSAWLVQK